MARLLVTRPEPEASETATVLRAAGHAPLVAPIWSVEATGEPFPPIRPDAVLLTSRRALTVMPAIPSDWEKTPVYCVGARTADAARHAGLPHIRVCADDARALIDAIPRGREPGERLLYLAGEPRRPDIEAQFTDAGFLLATIIRYRMHRKESLPAPAAEALRAGTIDGVLHFSPEGARAFFLLARVAGCTDAARRPMQLCLSEAIADAARETANDPLAVHIASRPRMQELLALIPSSGWGGFGLT